MVYHKKKRWPENRAMGNTRLRKRNQKRFRSRRRQQRGGSTPFVSVPRQTLRTKGTLAEIHGIPLSIYMTWHSKTVPVQMKESIDRMIAMNPEFNVHIYDAGMSREFIERHFGPEVVDAYDTLIPIAFKSDLWRYCLLYILGGIYLDIKYYSVMPLIDVVKDLGEFFVKDVESTCNACDPQLAIWNGLIAVKKGNPVLKDAIDAIVENCRNKTIPAHPMNISGPCLLGGLFISKGLEDLLKLDLAMDASNEDLIKAKVVYNEMDLLKQYEGYRDDQKLYKQPHWLDQWNAGNIYK